MKTIYEYFGCSNNDELYILLKNNDSRVKELKEFLSSLEKYNDRGIEELYKINSPEDFIEFSKEKIFPKENDIVVIGLNASNTIVSSYRFNPILEEKSTMEILKEINTKSLLKFAIIYKNTENDRKIRDKVDNIERELKEISFRNLDILKVFNDYIISEKSRIKYEYQDYEVVDDALKIKGRKLENINEITKLKGYDDFIISYIKKEIIGLDYIKNKEKIYNTLKLGYEHLGYEKMGFIKIDENLKVIDLKEYSNGDIDSAIVPKNKILKDCLVDDAKTYIFYHNHPSGSLNPSLEDISMTKSIDNSLKILDKKIIDSVIVSNEGYFSLKDSDNEYSEELYKNYRDALKIIDKNNKSIKKEKNLKVTLDNDLSEFLYHSIDVVNMNNSVIAKQFIVDVDNEKKEFTVYNEKNPKLYREYKLSFSYLENIGKIDGDENICKITKCRKDTVERKLEDYRTWKEEFGKIKEEKEKYLTKNSRDTVSQEKKEVKKKENSKKKGKKKSKGLSL